ncbi:cysteinyl leukotriene receptor 1-like [Amblyraja radiata]|uniref:cysteinyl leukotriene receptor 1-like n=1 Tax=Amblyraja radiata TaxID=386614 RepID=UPI00140223FF|nr:cysteinyl leukotriene receptor 1-like [Amblyraja radiata]
MNNTVIFENDTCENIDDFKKYTYLPVYIITFVLGFCENVFCLYVFLKLYKRKTAFSIVMANLAIADLLFLCTLPLRALYYYQGGIWNFPHSLCTFMSYAMYLNMYCSIYFLTLMSILRYFAVVHPLNCLKYRSTKMVLIVCIFIWVFLGLLASPILKDDSITKENNTTCFDPEDNDNIKIYNMNLISLTMGCIIPFFIITICYIFVVKTLLTSKTEHEKQKNSRRKAIIMIIIVMVIFLANFLPYHILRTVHLHIKTLHNKNTTHDNCLIQKTVVVTLCGVAINTCLDPLLYYFGAESFRNKLRNPSTLNRQIRFSPIIN